MSSTIATEPFLSSTPLKWKLWLGRALTAIVAGMMLLSASMKLAGGPQMAEMFTNKFGYPPGTLTIIAALEITSVVLYLLPQTAALGAIVLTGYLGGAVATHVRISDVAFLTPLAIGVVAWAGLYLRDARLVALLPLRRQPSQR